MSQIHIQNQQYKYCSKCRHQRPKSIFFRNSRTWATCNICSGVSTTKRNAETRDATIRYGICGYNDVAQRIAVLPIGPQQSNDLMAQELTFQQQQQLFVEKCWQQLQLLQPQMTLGYLLDDHYQLSPSPLEVAEEYYRQQLQNVQLLMPKDFITPTDSLQASYSWNNSCPVTQQPAAQEDDLDLDFENAFLSGIAEMNYEESIKQHVANDFGSCNVGDSDMMDVNSEIVVDGIHHAIGAQEAASQAQQETANHAHTSIPAKHVRQKLRPFTLDPYFADFNPSEDLLRQPPSPNHNLTGNDLAKHQVRELGLALRLSLLPSHWHNTRHNNWYKEIEKLDQLEESGRITAWGPLSDWLVMYENGLENILETYPIGTELNPTVAYKVRAAKAALFKSLRESIRDEAERLLQENKEALLMFFVERSGRAQGTVKLALDRQLRRMKNAIEQDCALHGILCP
jgi:hypothetical protein